MARFLSQSLHRYTSFTRSSSFIPVTHNRHRSFKAQLIEIDIGASSSAACDGDSGEVESLAMKKLEELIYRIVVQKSTPDWLPFVPGSSFWVPPRRPSSTVVDLVSKLTNQLTEEETLALTTLRGWPCSSLLLEDVLKMDVEKKMVKEDGEQVEIRVEVLPDSENSSQPEDEDR